MFLSNKATHERGVISVYVHIRRYQYTRVHARTRQARGATPELRRVADTTHPTACQQAGTPAQTQTIVGSPVVCVAVAGHMERE